MSRKLRSAGELPVIGSQVQRGSRPADPWNCTYVHGLGGLPALQADVYLWSRPYTAIHD